MADAAEREQLIRKIEALPSLLEEAVRGLSDEQLDTPYRDGGWTVRQVVHHLADSHVNALVRLKLMLTEDHPTLKPYDQDAWSNLPDSRLPLAPSLAILRGLHQRWATLLRSIPDSDWARAAFHPEAGEMTPETIMSIYSGHGEKHVGHIRSLRVAKGW
jgi:hypothetical protein